MGYLSEYVGEKDVQKYNLLEVIRRCLSNEGWEPNSTYKYMWSSDNENGNFLIHLKNIAEDGASGRAEPTSKDLFFLL